jgi:hypothetical protein
MIGMQVSRTSTRPIRPIAIACALAIALAGCGGSSPSTPSAVSSPTPQVATATPSPSPTAPASAPPATVSSMLDGLPAYIASALADNQASLPRNPSIATYIQAKITMLQDPNLAAAIRNDRRWTASANSRIPIACVFPAESMRNEASVAVATLEPVLPLLEEFFAKPFQTPAIRVWYGFAIGNSGGGGTINSEDRTTYEARTPATRLPFDAILSHELGHSYISNESLNQFLELYTYNVLRTGSRLPSSWTFVRGWTPGLAANQDVAAVLDIYQLVGHDAMTRGYRAIQPLNPTYGSPLTASVIQAFVDQMSPEHRSQVTEKLRRVTF